MNKKILNEEELKKHAIEVARKMAERIRKREKESENLILSNDYILWLQKFTEKYPSFTDEDGLDYNKEMTYEDAKNVLKIGLLFEQIQKYARNNFIYPQDKIESYNIEYNNIGYTIGLITGQESFFFCERGTPTQDFISFLDIQNNIEQSNTRVIKGKLEALKIYLNNLLEENIPLEAITETTQKVLQKRY